MPGGEEAGLDRVRREEKALAREVDRVGGAMQVGNHEIPLPESPGAIRNSGESVCKRLSVHNRKR